MDISRNQGLNFLNSSRGRGANSRASFNICLYGFFKGSMWHHRLQQQGTGCQNTEPQEELYCSEEGFTQPSVLFPLGPKSDH